MPPACLRKIITAPTASNDRSTPMHTAASKNSGKLKLAVNLHMTLFERLQL